MVVSRRRCLRRGRRDDRVWTQAVIEILAIVTPIITERGISLSWPLVGTAATGIAWIVRYEVNRVRDKASSDSTVAEHSKNITALWDQVNDIRSK